MLSPLPSLDVRFELAVDRPPELEFLGPTVRGMLGHGLRHSFCGHRTDASGRCAAGHACTYARLFEGASSRLVGLPLPPGFTPPAPMVLEVDQVAARRASPCRDDGLVKFVVRLFGAAIADADALTEAVSSRQRHGLGAVSRRFDLMACSACNATSGDTAGAHGCVPDGSEVEFQFITPMSLRHGQRMQVRVNPSLLIAAARRRSWLMRALHGSATDHPEGQMMRGVDHAALPWSVGEARIHASETDTRFFVSHEDTYLWRMRRRSGRQRQVVPMEGLRGSVSIVGPWANEQWLADVERLHVGKHTSFGFGQVTVQARSPKTPRNIGDNRRLCEPSSTRGSRRQRQAQVRESATVAL